MTALPTACPRCRGQLYSEPEHLDRFDEQNIWCLACGELVGMLYRDQFIATNDHAARRALLLRRAWEGKRR